MGEPPTKPLGLTIQEGSPYVIEGSWWARLQPFGLMQADIVPHGGSGTSGTFKLWTPKGIEEFCTLLPMKSDAARLLWFNHFIATVNCNETSSLYFYAGFAPGDVMIVNDRIWFVGPDTGDNQLHVLADWNVSESEVLMARRIQLGPPRDTNFTRFDRVTEESR